tara:strand:+ start:401 stop:685 length:285 start_codon:yes stop_codon:yes gene_type:complete
MEGYNMTAEEIKSLTQAIFELRLEIQKMSERQDEMLEDVKKIKEAVYNPDSGIYARLRALELWRENQMKFQAPVVLTLLGLVTATVYKIVFPIN